MTVHIRDLYAALDDLESSLTRAIADVRNVRTLLGELNLRDADRERHRCETCGIEFASDSRLREHAVNVHGDEEPAA